MGVAKFERILTTHDVPSQLASLDLLNSEEMDGNTYHDKFRSQETRTRELDALVGTKVSVKKVYQLKEVSKDDKKYYDSESIKVIDIVLTRSRQGLTARKVAVHNPARIP